MEHVGGRGVSRRSVKELSKQSNWTGEDFQKHQEDVKERSPDSYVTVGRGTKKIKLGDIKASTTPSAKGRYVSTGRGTGRRKVE